VFYLLRQDPVVKSPKEWTRKTTITILISTVSALILWDIWVFIEPTDGDTISEVTLGFASDHPVVALIIGVVMGHLFWPQRIDKKTE
jgi:hypothetical protein